MTKIDLNCDLGESFGAYTIGMDAKVIPLISSANIACGFHASDPVVMQKTVCMAKEAGIGIGAHPGYPDLMGFGRREMKISPEEAGAYITYQLGALHAFAKSAGVKLQLPGIIQKYILRREYRRHHIVDQALIIGKNNIRFPARVQGPDMNIGMLRGAVLCQDSRGRIRIPRPEELGNRSRIIRIEGTIVPFIKTQKDRVIFDHRQIFQFLLLL